MGRGRMRMRIDMRRRRCGCICRVRHDDYHNAFDSDRFKRWVLGGKRHSLPLLACVYSSPLNSTGQI